ncbi:hypothetical protein BKM31_44385 [[Actinomadura] parvosata subsp. kistnae]|uniref:Uncharacterized protein n=2 Tax=Nonomuraea TaxID=83681 RepID=A0A1V0ALY8_9ACTN|nr:hypothetical protein BKM31_44385 [Nonomuraea sp. ATCC 55076]
MPYGGGPGYGPGSGGYAPPPPPPSSGSTGMLIGMLFAGLAIYSVLNLVVGFFLFFAAMGASGSANPYLAAGAVILAVAGLGAGVGLCFVRKPWSRGLGLGLMIGWALWSILSAGICTGLNPSLYG